MAEDPTGSLTHDAKFFGCGIPPPLPLYFLPASEYAVASCTEFSFPARIQAPCKAGQEGVLEQEQIIIDCNESHTDLHLDQLTPFFQSWSSHSPLLPRTKKSAEKTKKHIKWSHLVAKITLKNQDGACKLYWSERNPPLLSLLASLRLCLCLYLCR